MASTLREGFMNITQDADMTNALMAVCESVARMTNELEKKPMLEAADGKGNEYETLKDLAIWLLNESTAFNVIHWNVDSSNRHELLNEAYDLFRDTADKLGEDYVGYTDKDAEVSGKFTFPSIDKGDEAVKNHLKEIQKHMQDAIDKNGKFGEGIKNVFADFDEKMNEIIYKWSRFHT